jgi:type II secretory pathway component PulM
MNALLAAWRSRSDTDRARLTALAAFVAFVLVVALAWLPMQRASTRLAESLPAERVATATMRRQAGEVAALRAAPPRNTAAMQALAGLAGSGPLAQALPGAQVTALDERRLAVTAGDVSWGALLEWIAGARAQHGLDVGAARVEALSQPGRVRAELTLERP